MLETTMNTRELGGYRTFTGSRTEFLSFIRSDKVLYPNERDIDFLVSRQILTVIDMREERDVRNFPSPFAAMGQFQYFHVPIEEGSRIPESAREVPYSYFRIAESANMREVFRIMSGAESGVLYHCSAGKDRTGVVSAILLLLAGVSRADIVENYMITKECNRERFCRFRRNFPERDINIVIPHEKYMVDFLDMFLAKYTDAGGYLAAVGLSGREIVSLKNKLVKE